MKKPSKAKQIAEYYAYNAANIMAAESTKGSELQKESYEKDQSWIDETTTYYFRQDCSLLVIDGESVSLASPFVNRQLG